MCDDNNYDKPSEEEISNPLLMWQRQISGECNFDESSFAGTINDLAYDVNWKQAFAGLPNSEGFIKHLEELYKYQSVDLEGDERYVYFHPLARNAGTSDELLGYAKRHIEELRGIANLAQAYELEKQLEDPDFIWLGEGVDLMPLMQNYDLLYIDIYETIGDYLIFNRVEEWAHIHSCLREACYMIACDYGLANYLLSDFYNFDLDFSHYFKLWVHGGDYAFDENNNCVVTSVEYRESE